MLHNWGAHITLPIAKRLLSVGADGNFTVSCYVGRWLLYLGAGMVQFLIRTIRTRMLPIGVTLGSFQGWMDHCDRSSKPQGEPLICFGVDE
ncbi:hypothetical protein BV22DRAFT_1034837 [Leucogyrophana mollusca]|uniref:Uncharacterized protein n=1 Tax=Leucogyrophana mollusca TaxID=85980 RepID=A0ACB8BIQ8_9AGAM|nr:hypothetical protein BV22DRAFT_1034837 [Leucogyrophana mollusca]